MRSLLRLQFFKLNGGFAVTMSYCSSDAPVGKLSAALGNTRGANFLKRKFKYARAHERAE